MLVANRYGPINGRQYAPGDPIEEPEKIGGQALALLIQQRVIVLATDPQAPKPKPKWTEPAAEPTEEIETDDKKGARAKRK